MVTAIVVSQEGAQDSERKAQVTVAATIFPLADIVKNVGGERVEVLLLIPPGASEHSQALTPQQLQDLSRASTIFRIGHGLDDQLTERIHRSIPSLGAVTVDRGIVLREFGEEEEHEEQEHEEGEEAEEHHHDTGEDPHYWLSVPNGIKIASTVAEALIQLDPAGAQVYQQNLAAYQSELEAIETELQASAAKISLKEFMAVHNAWSYLADQYGFQLVATYEPVEGQTPSVADLQRIKAIVEEHGITTFYAEPQKLSSAANEFMEREFGLKVLTLDPVGGGPETGSYAALMRFNLSALAQGQ